MGRSSWPVLPIVPFLLASCIFSCDAEDGRSHSEDSPDEGNLDLDVIGDTEVESFDGADLTLDEFPDTLDESVDQTVVDTLVDDTGQDVLDEVFFVDVVDSADAMAAEVLDVPCGDGVWDEEGGEVCDASDEGDNGCEEDTYCIDTCTLCAPQGFVYVPAGTFCMGSPDGSTECMGVTDPEDRQRHSYEEPQHEVTLTNAFFMQEHEVTQAQWRELAEWWNAQSSEFRNGISMGTDPSWFSGSADGADCGDDCPVERVSWWDAVFFSNAMSLREGLEVCYVCSEGWSDTPGGGCDADDSDCSSGDICYSGFSFVGYECAGYRLPTEAEWEYAYRAGSRTVFYPSDGNDGTFSEGNLAQIGWYYGNSDRLTHPVSPLNEIEPRQPNAWGLYDMSGNVWELVWDWYDSDYYESSPVRDPLGGEGSTRVQRGGAWGAYAREARGAQRSQPQPDTRRRNIGFRLARTAP